MLLKVLDIDGVKYATSCTVTGARVLTFYCHNEAKVQTYVEALPFAEFQQRLLSLNARVKFPDNAVRNMLLVGESSQAIMAAEPNSAGVWVLALKFVMAETPAPLKWEWHLKPMETVTFYRKLLVDAIDVSHELHVIVQTLVKDLCAKDKELEQYRREGFQLRRTTVRTKSFDLPDFNDENKDLFEEATAYNDLNEVFPCGISSYSHSREPSSVPTTPSTRSSSSSTMSPSSVGYRCRKRRARANHHDRLERNIKKRNQNPTVQFNSQSSQEEQLTDWLVENGTKQEHESASGSSKPPLDLAIKTESLQNPKAVAAATIKTEKVEEPKKATTAPKIATVKTEKVAEPEKANNALGEENNNESLTESDQELNELRAILAASMAQKRLQRQK